MKVLLATSVILTGSFLVQTAAVPSTRTQRSSAIEQAEPRGQGSELEVLLRRAGSEETGASRRVRSYFSTRGPYQRLRVSHETDQSDMHHPQTSKHSHKAKSTSAKPSVSPTIQPESMSPRSAADNERLAQHRLHYLDLLKPEARYAFYKYSAPGVLRNNDQYPFSVYAQHIKEQHEKAIKNGEGGTLHQRLRGGFERMDATIDNAINLVVYEDYAKKAEQAELDKQADLAHSVEVVTTSSKSSGFFGKLKGLVHV